MDTKLHIISYDLSFVAPEGARVSGRNPRFWEGEVESGFTHVVASDPRIVAAYADKGVPLYEQAPAPAALPSTTHDVPSTDDPLDADDDDAFLKE